ncbi:mucin-17 [Biomphalaria pfeifferi]|uniref:Mucin-17 n=1 Tax=Biomphalaria pfeifferi TaxID=112525 RepID=A0AAD8F1L9_BIOPF|nr:mucin-17 [Biomphalaria pfeifferi]
MWDIIVSVLAMLFALTCRPVVSDEGVTESILEAGLLSTPPTSDVDTTASSPAELQSDNEKLSSSQETSAGIGDIAQDSDIGFPSNTLATTASAAVEESPVQAYKESEIADSYSSEEEASSQSTTSTPTQISDASSLPSENDSSPTILEAVPPENNAFDSSVDTPVSAQNISNDTVLVVTPTATKMVDSVEETEQVVIPPPPPATNDTAQNKTGEVIAEVELQNESLDTSIGNEEKDKLQAVYLNHLNNLKKVLHCELKLKACQQQIGYRRRDYCDLVFKQCLLQIQKEQEGNAQKRSLLDPITTKHEAALPVPLTNLLETVLNLLGNTANQVGNTKPDQLLVSPEKKCPFTNEPSLPSEAPNVIPAVTCDTPLVADECTVSGQDSIRENFVPIIEPLKNVPSSTNCECMQSLSDGLVSGLTKGITDGLSNSIQEILKSVTEQLADVFSKSLAESLAKLLSSLNTIINSALTSLTGITNLRMDELLKTKLDKVTDLLNILPLKDVGVENTLGVLENVVKPLDSLLESATNTVGNLLNSAGSLNAVGTINSAVKPIESIVSGITNAAGNLVESSGTLTSAISATEPVATITGAVEPVVSLLNNVGSNVGNLVNTVETLTSAVNKISNAIGPVTGTAYTVTSLAGDVPSMTSATQPVSTLTGAVGGVPSLPSATQTVSTLTGAVGGVPSLPSATQPVFTLTGAVGGVPSLPSSTQPVSTLTGAVGEVPSMTSATQPVSTLTGAVGGVPSMTSATQPVSTLTGAVGGVPSMTSATQPVSTLTGAVGGVPSMTSATQPVSTLTGAVGGVPSMTSATQPVSTLTGAVGGVPSMTSATQPVSTLTGTVSEVPSLTSATNSISTQSGLTSPLASLTGASVPVSSQTLAVKPVSTLNSATYSVAAPTNILTATNPPTGLLGLLGRSIVK